jgi:hypothetical protein
VPLTVKLSAEDAVRAFDAVIALLAQLAVPCSEPVIPPITFNEPVTSTLLTKATLSE